MDNEFTPEEMLRINSKIQDILSGKLPRAKARWQYNKYVELLESNTKSHEEAYKEWLNIRPSSWGHRVIGHLKVMSDTEFASYLNGKVNYYQVNIEYDKRQMEMWEYILEHSKKIKGKKKDVTTG